MGLWDVFIFEHERWGQFYIDSYTFGEKRSFHYAVFNIPDLYTKARRIALELTYKFQVQRPQRFLGAYRT